MRTVTEHERHIRERHEQMGRGGNIKHDILCDHCGTQLINPRPNTFLTTHPPQQYAQCPNEDCGWAGRVSM